MRSGFSRLPRLEAPAKPLKQITAKIRKKRPADRNFEKVLSKNQLQRKTGEIRRTHKTDYTTGPNIGEKQKRANRPTAICPEHKIRSSYFIRSSRMYLTISHICLSFKVFLWATIAGWVFEPFLIIQNIWPAETFFIVALQVKFRGALGDLYNGLSFPVPSPLAP